MSGTGVAPSRLAAAPLIGRDTEVALVRDGLAAGEFVLIAGAAGVGKSRLVAAGLEQRPPAGVLVLRCLPYRQPQAFAAVIDAVRDRVDDVAALRLSPVAGALRPLLPEWHGQLPELPSGSDDWPLAQHQVFRAIAELLDALGIDTLVVEDAQWAEAATVDLLLFLASRPRATLLTYRPDEAPPAGPLGRVIAHLAGPRVDLAGLDVEHTARLVSELLSGAEVSESFARFLHRRTDGVPLAIEESLRLLLARQDIAWVDGEWVRRTLDELDVPSSVRDAVLVWLTELDPDARWVVDACAVLGEAESVEVVLAVADVDDARGRDGLGLLLDRGLLVADGAGRIGLRHALTARAALEAVAPSRRPGLHARAAAALAGRVPPPMARLARHHREAGHPAQAADYADHAAEQALATGDVPTAVLLVHSALTGLDLPTEAGLRLLEKLPLWGLTDRAAVGELVDRLRQWLATTADPPARAELRFHLGRMLLAADDAPAGRAELDRATDGLTHRPDLEARALAILAAGREPDRPAADLTRWRTRARALAPTLAPPLRIDIELDVLCSELEAGAGPLWPLATALPREAAAGPQRAAVLRCNLNISDLGMRWGMAAESDERIGLALRQAAEQGLPRLHYLASSGRVHLDWFLGRWAGLADALDALGRHPGVQPEPTTESVVLVALVRIVGDESSSAQAALAAAAGSALAQLCYGDACEASAALTHLALAAGDPDGAVAAGAEQLDVVRRSGAWLFGGELFGAHIEALTAAGRRSEALGLQAELDAVAARCGAPVLVAARHWGAAALAPDDVAAAREFAASAAAWTQAGRPFPTALATGRQGAALARAHDREGAIAAFDRAGAGCAELGAGCDEARFAARLAELGAGRRRGYGDELSPREAEVIALVATGRTNREIAAELSRSPKTVSTQLQSAMRKLGVGSRTGAAVRAIERGLVPADGAAVPADGAADGAAHRGAAPASGRDSGV